MIHGGVEHAATAAGDHRASIGLAGAGPIALPGCRCSVSSGLRDDVDARSLLAQDSGHRPTARLFPKAALEPAAQLQLESHHLGVDCESIEQATERSQGSGSHNVGEEAALAAIEMARLVKDWR